MLSKVKALFGPFYSDSFYSNLIAKKRGLGLDLLVVILLINLAFLGFISYKPLELLRQEQQTIFEALPELTIQAGVISVNPPEAQKISFLKESPDGPVTIMFDTQSDPLDEATLVKKMRDEKISLYVDRSGATVYAADTGEHKYYAIDKEKDQTITHEKWMEISRMLDRIIVPASLVTFSFILFLTHLVSACGGALLLLIVEPLFKVDVPFAGLLRLALAAKIPVAVIFCFVAPQIAIKTVIWFGFAIFGLLAYKRSIKT